MSDFMLGCDISRYQYGEWNPSYSSFVMIKATEGTTYKDPAMEKFVEKMATDVPDNCPFIGFYHYARADKNTPAQEVNNFLNTIKPHIGNCLLALDFENESFSCKNPDAWATQFCMNVETQTGTKPLLYVSASYVKRFPVTLARFPLWVAHYNVQKPGVVDCKPKIWQFTSKPFDIDIFYGNPADMVKLIKGE